LRNHSYISTSTSRLVTGPQSHCSLLSSCASLSRRQRQPRAAPVTMSFGDFTWICEKVSLPLCSAVGPPSAVSGATGIQAQCYSRSIELANTIIFQGATDFMHILALIMTAVMIIHVRSKFTAVGRWSHCILHTQCLLTHMLRPEGNYYIFLHLHGPNRPIPHSRLRRRCSWYSGLSLVRCRAKRPRLRPMRVPPHQWLCRVPALRRWDDALGLAITALLTRHVHHLGSCIASDLQGMGWPWTDKHHWPLRSTLHFQRHLPHCILRHASLLGCQHPARPLATWRSRIWLLFLCRWPGHPLCPQRYHLQYRQPLPGRSLFRDNLQLTCCNDGLQSKLSILPACETPANC
jgi:hypothetical protein